MSAAAATIATRPGGRRQPRSAAEWFLAIEIAFQLALLVPALNFGPARVLWRTGAFAASLAMLVLLRGRARKNAVNLAALWVLAILAVEIFHPLANTLVAAIAECAMYLAILAPLFWVARLQVDLDRFRRALHWLWGYYTLSVLVGVAQVYFPGRFEPKLSPVVASMGSAVEGLKIVLSNGKSIFRPMGLTDMPGGAANAGMWALLFGLGFLLAPAGGGKRGTFWMRAAYFGSMGCSIVVIYLSQSRATLLTAAIWFAALLALLAWQGRWRQFAILAALTLALGLGGLRFATRLGGRSLVQRLATLTGAHRSQLYASERGRFLSQTFHTLIPEFPFGAGLGRWGMMHTYFGHDHDPRRALIYVEIQWQGWVLDGGLPLLAAYLALLGCALGSLARIARRPGPLATWAALCFAYDVGVLALTFDYTPFTGQMGLDFWFLNALVLAAAACARNREARSAS